MSSGPNILVETVFPPAVDCPNLHHNCYLLFQSPKVPAQVLLAGQTLWFPGRKRPQLDLCAAYLLVDLTYLRLAGRQRRTRQAVRLTMIAEHATRISSACSRWLGCLKNQHISSMSTPHPFQIRWRRSYWSSFLYRIVNQKWQCFKVSTITQDYQSGS